MSWNPILNLSIPWIRELSEKFSQIDLPIIRGKTLWVSSDYCFGNPSSDFDVISLLLADPENSFGWEGMRREVRAKLLPDGRRMSWKRLRDRQRQSAFFPFLSAADHIHGLCVAIAIQRDPAFRISTPEILEEYRGRPWLSANWNAENFEQLVRIGFFTALFVAGISKPAQDVLWISDQDAVFANEIFHRDTGILFSKFLTMFSSHSYGQVAVGTTSITEDDLLEEDLGFIPDLMCGAACEIVTLLKRSFGDIPRIPCTLPKLSERAQNFMQWFAGEPSHRLKKCIGLLERRRNRGLAAGVLTFA